ncbi:MAG: ABC transporter permease [Lachnospiraceae bacterium]|nr:ABC transporter permease [Eubacteriales bacterium]
MKSKIKLPQIIISLFMLSLFVLAGFLKMNIPELVSGSFVKFVMNGVLVLAMIPMINAGVGMNFGLPVGIVAGLLGMCMAIQLRVTGIFGFITAILLSIIPAVVFGLLYAKILNMVKGKEDIAAIFIGYSFIPIMNFVWTVIPFSNREMLYPVGGEGLRPKISLENYFGNVLNELFVVKIGEIVIPLGLLGVYAIICLLIHFFFKTKYGTVMLAVGENEKFCQLSGIKINKVRTTAIVLSTVIGAVGICVYAQTYGFVELYNAPLSHTFPAVSVILIGGCIGKRATIFHAILGTYLYQTIYLLSAPIANAILIPQMSEIVRMIITNGIILYAFLKQKRRK